MTMIRRAILAFALIAGINPAFAQVPPPVPALPDTERRTSYSLTGSTCTCSVGFQLYGDSTDFANWLTVWVNGVQQIGGWTITSPTGPLATIPRPIVDGVLTFSTAKTGTVQIVGARRPRRASQFPENRGVAARDFNVALTDLVAQNREVWDKTNDLTGRVLRGVPGDIFNPFPAPSVRAATILGFDTNGNLAYLPLGPTISVTAGSTFNTQGLAAAASISVTVQFVQTAGYAAAGDGGGALYSKAGGTTPCGFQSADGQWWTPDFSRGANIRVCGAGLGSGAADVAAMTAIIQINGPFGAVGVNIIIPDGNYDFSTGQFLFTKDGTRILCGGMSTTAIKFNPASAATLFTFWRSGDANGIGNSEMSNCRIYSTNAVQKHILTISNSTGFILRKNFMSGITDAGGASIAILYQGRNWFIHEDNFITADFPFFFNTNPDRALAGFEDADFTTGARNQYATNQTNGAVYTVQTGLNVTNWTAKNEDWAGGHRGVDAVDSTATANSGIWTFENIRREQETGVNPTMLVIHRSGAGKLRDLRVISPSVALGQLADLTGIDRANFVKPFFNTDGVNILVADSTVSNLNWTGMFASPGNTLALSGQTLVKGRERVGGTEAAPIYMDATYTNVPQGTIEWIGAPSANGRRMGIWRAVADVPVSTGLNDFALLPWSLYTVLYAEIKVSSPTISGFATFRSGQAAGAGNAILVGQTSFAVDGGAGHLSVYNYSDTNVSIVNKLAGPVPVTVEVLFTE